MILTMKSMLSNPEFKFISVFRSFELLLIFDLICHSMIEEILKTLNFKLINHQFKNLPDQFVFELFITHSLITHRD